MPTLTVREATPDDVTELARMLDQEWRGSRPAAPQG